MLCIDVVPLFYAVCIYVGYYVCVWYMVSYILVSQIDFVSEKILFIHMHFYKFYFNVCVFITITDEMLIYV